MVAFRSTLLHRPLKDKAGVLLLFRNRLPPLSVWLSAAASGITRPGGMGTRVKVNMPRRRRPNQAMRLRASVSEVKGLRSSGQRSGSCRRQHPCLYICIQCTRHWRGWEEMITKLDAGTCQFSGSLEGVCRPTCARLEPVRTASHAGPFSDTKTCFAICISLDRASQAFALLSGASDISPRSTCFRPTIVIPPRAFDLLKSRRLDDS